MAPFTISPHHPLPYQCGRPQEALLMQSKMSPELLSSKPGTNDLPLNHNRTTSITKIRLHLWHVIRKVVNCCMSVTELFCSKMFLFICVGKNMAMTGELKKSGAEALEWEIRDGKDPEMKVIMKFEEEEEEEELIEPAVEQESSMIDSDEEEDEARLSEWESDEETDEEEEEEDDEDNEEEDCEPQDVDSEWSDDDDDDSEASAESLELWESFLNSSDPYNPLSFCSSTGSTKNTKQNQLTPSPQIKTQPTPARPEECHPKPNSKEGGKKVCFSDEVTVHPLVAWSFASRAARDGSCWLQMARDRDRFRRRVENIENVLKPCLTPEHRASVWERLQRTTLS